MWTMPSIPRSQVRLAMKGFTRMIEMAIMMLTAM